MASYGKKMLEAALRANAEQKKTGQMTKRADPPEHGTHDKVSHWLDTCPDSTSEVHSEKITQSVSTKRCENYFPTLQSDSDSTDDGKDQDYQPSSDDEDSMVSNENRTNEPTHDKTTSNEIQYVSHAVSRNGALILNKQQYCYYCEKPQLKLARHLTTQHKSESAVAQLLAAKSINPRKYQASLKRIKCLGNFVHNVQSLKTNKSDIVVVKRPTKQRKVTEYLPCIHCYGFYVVDELWKHTKSCDLKGHDIGSSSDIVKESMKLLTSSSAVRQSRLLLDTACLQDQSSLSQEMRTLITSMHQDELCEAVKKDILLSQFGETLLMKYGPRKKNDIGQRLRQLARLLLKCREKISDPSLQFIDLLCGKHFDTCLSGTLELCEMTVTVDGRREFKIPSLALRLGHLLKKMTTIKQGYCLRNDHLEALKQTESFGQLLQAEWTDSIASNAHNTLKRRKDQTVQVLPLIEDLKKMRQFQMREVRQCIDKLQEAPSYFTWRKLAQLTMTRMIIFNKRRGGEVSKLLLQTYTTRPDWKSSTNQEVLASLQPLEIKLLDRVDLVQIPGKKNRKVPMLITADVKEAIEALNAHRDVVGIPSSNPYCFASRSAGHLDSWQAMSSISHEASLQRPELVTSTKLRKYNATVSQLFDLNHGELEWLANHMGHDLNIHRDFYRLHDSTIEIAKVSRLLMAIDSGSASQFVGKQLTEISLEDFGSKDIEGKEIEIDAVASESVTFSKDDDHQQHLAQEKDISTPNAKSGKEVHETGEFIPEILAEDDSEPNRHSLQKNNTRKLKGSNRKRKRTRITSDSEDEDSMSNTKKQKGSKRKRKLTTITSDSDDDSQPAKHKHNKSSQKSGWTAQEIQVLENTFSHILRQGTYPSGNQIQIVITQNPCLQKRTILNVRAKLQHLMKKKY